MSPKICDDVSLSATPDRPAIPAPATTATMRTTAAWTTGLRTVMGMVTVVRWWR